MVRVSKRFKHLARIRLANCLVVDKQCLLDQVFALSGERMNQGQMQRRLMVGAYLLLSVFGVLQAMERGNFVAQILLGPAAHLGFLLEIFRIATDNGEGALIVPGGDGIMTAANIVIWGGFLAVVSIFPTLKLWERFLLAVAWLGICAMNVIICAIRSV